MRSPLLILAGLLLASPTPAVAQQDPVYRGAWDGLRPVDPGSSDLGSLGVDARWISRDLRQPLDFETLFRGEGPGGRAWFARRDGGLTAVFPRSDYAWVGSREVSLIPPDTTFVIGEPSRYTAARLGIAPVAAASPSDPSGGLRLDTRINLAARAPGSIIRGFDHAPEEQAPPRRGVGRLLRMASERERAAEAQ